MFIYRKCQGNPSNSSQWAWANRLLPSAEWVVSNNSNSNSLGAPSNKSQCSAVVLPPASEALNHKWAWVALLKVCLVSQPVSSSNQHCLAVNRNLSLEVLQPLSPLCSAALNQILALEQSHSVNRHPRHQLSVHKPRPLYLAEAQQRLLHLVNSRHLGPLL